MKVRKTKNLGRWKFSFIIYNWLSWGLGLEYQHPEHCFGCKFGPFLFCVEWLEKHE